MLRALQRAGVKRIVCSSHDALLADPAQGNRDMEQAVVRNPDVLAAYWLVNPNYPELAAWAAENFQQSRGFVGFKFLPDYHVYPLTGDRYRPALEYANETGFAGAGTHLGRQRLRFAPDARRGGGKVPARVVSDGAFRLRRLAGLGPRGARLPNVFLELTAVYVAHDFAMQPNGSGTPVALLSCLQVNGILEHMVSEAGSGKIVFGTDLPWYSPLYAAGAVLFAGISDDARHDILHRNAERLLSGIIHDPP